jgi:hypothetical protein
MISPLNDKNKVYVITIVVIVCSMCMIHAFTPPVGDVQASPDSKEIEPDPPSDSLVEFDGPVNVTDNGEDSVYGQIATSNDNVYLVWQESAPGDTHRNYEILFKKSIDDGNTFGEQMQLSNNVGFSEHPQLAADRHNVYVVWADDTNINKQIFFRKSNDDGNTFGEQMQLSDGDLNSFNQEISAFGNNVYVVWLEKVPLGPYRVMLATSDDGGNTFHEPIALSENAMGQTFPKISVFNGHVYVTWNVEEYPNTESGVFFVSSSDNAATFGNVSKLNKEERDYGEPQVASSGNRVYVIWGGSDQNKVSNLYFVKSGDNGRTFSPIKKIDETEQGRLNNPSNVEITLDQSQRLLIAWQDQLGTTEKGEILFATSVNDGESFEGVTNLSNNIDISECPSIIADGNIVFATWEDLTPGNHEIFFAHGTGF